MNRVQFLPDEGTLFYRELNSRVNAYFLERAIEKHGGKSFIHKMLFYFGLNVLFYILMMNSHETLWFMATYLAMGISVLLTAFNVSHDAAHGVAVKSPFWNKFLFSLSFNLQGNNAYVWGKNHTESHHSFTNIEGSDIDVLDNPLFRMHPGKKWRWFHRFQFIYAPFLYLFYSLNWFLFRDTLLLFHISSRTIEIKLPINEAFKLVFFKVLYIGYMVVIPIYFLPIDWVWIIMAFLINHALVSLIFVAVLGVSHVSDIVEHPVVDAKNQINMSWALMQLKTSVDYSVDSRFFNLTLGGFNAHTLHHLLPHVSHVHYLKILPIFRNLCAEYGLKYNEMSYLESLQAHFRFLKLMGKQDAKSDML